MAALKITNVLASWIHISSLNKSLAPGRFMILEEVQVYSDPDLMGCVNAKMLSMEPFVPPGVPKAQEIVQAAEVPEPPPVQAESDKVEENAVPPLLEENRGMQLPQKHQTSTVVTGANGNGDVHTAQTNGKKLADTGLPDFIDPSIIAPMPPDEKDDVDPSMLDLTAVDVIKNSFEDPGTPLP